MNTPQKKPIKNLSKITKAELAKRLQAAHTLIDEQHEKLISLEKTVKEIPNNEEDDMENIPVSSSLFRISIYDLGQDALQGKIEHPLTKTKKAFKGLDQQTIADFILKHLPDADKQKLQKKSTTPKKKASLPSNLPEISVIEVIPQSNSMPKKLVSHASGFDVRLQIKPASGKKKNPTSPFHFLLYAKQLENGFQQMAGGTSKIMGEKVETISISVPPSKLSPGTYRLEAALSMGQTYPEGKSIVPLEGSSLLQVY